MKISPVVLILLAGFLFPVAVYLIQFHGTLSTDHGRWGEFGSYLSGVYGSLALVIVAYTTYLTQTQFKRQNNDSVFFKLIESLQYRIQQSTIIADGQEFSAHKSLKHIAERFHTELSVESVEIARMLLCKSPETVADVHYAKLLEAINGKISFATFQEERDAFVSDITSQANFNDRWEQLKYYIGSRGEETDEIREALRATGSVNFYKIPFKERQHHYANALRRIMIDHGEFLDGYFRNLMFVVNVAEVSGNKDLYINYIDAQLTRYETVIIFYLIAGREEPIPGAKSFMKLGLFSRLRTIDCQSLMIDLPSYEEIDCELREVFATEG